MGVSIPLTLYMTTTAFPGTNHGGLSTTPPAGTTTAAGWNCGTRAAGNISPMDFGIEVGRASALWSTTITNSGPNPVIGDSLVYGPLKGDFDESTWNVTWSLKSVTQGGTQRGRFLFRVYKTSTPFLTGSAYTLNLLSASYFSGSGGVPATKSYFETSITPSMVSTATQNRCTQSFTLGPQQFRDEYLMFQTFFNITTAGNNPNCDADYIIGPNSGAFKTANFISYRTQFIETISDDFG